MRSKKTVALHKHVWGELADTGITKRMAEVPFLALHGVLWTPAYRAHTSQRDRSTRISPLEAAQCQAATCAGQIAHTSHILVDCTVVAPAAQWLCDHWAALDPGNGPPRTADIIVAGNPTHWTPTVAPGLWTRLRCFYLQQAYAASFTLAAGDDATAAGIAAATRATAISHMRAEFVVALSSPESLASIAGRPVQHMTGSRRRRRDGEVDDEEDEDTGLLAFADCWAYNDILCSVVTAGVAPRLQVLWTRQNPVHLPA